MKKIETLFNNISSCENKYLEEIKYIIQINKENHNELTKIKNEYTLDNDKTFNLFTIFSDFYYRENFQSDILKIILDPNTVEIGNKIFLENFYTFLQDIINQTPSYKNDNVNFPKINSAKVIREENYIDLLIHDDQYAIILESKLNNAEDQPDQLARYYKYITTEKKLNVKCVLYLIPEENKYPNLYSYSEEYKPYIEKIKDKLLIIPALSTTKLNLVSNYLPDCIQATNSNLGKVLISQFIRLLKKNCGGLKTMEIEKKIFNQLCSTEENIEITNDIHEIWNKRHELIKNIILEKVLNDEKLGYLIWPSYNQVAYKKLNNSIILGLGIDDGLYFGFVHDPEVVEEIPKSQIDKFKEILSDNCFSDNSGKVEENGKWVFRTYIIKDRIQTIDFYYKDIKEKLLKLESLVVSSKKL